MKKLLALLVFVIGMVGCAYNQKKHCPPGHSWMPTLGTSSLLIEADTCLPDSVCKRLWLEYSKNMCQETSFTSGDFDYYISSVNTWVNDSIGCVSKETFKKRIKGIFVELSKCRYYYENKSAVCHEYNSEGHSKMVSCCGHTHTSPPK